MRGIFLILLIFLLAVVFRLWGGLDTMQFTYDQARDAFAAISILHGNLKIVGPPTDLPGVFHGPFYYYYLAPFYALGQGDPRLAFLGMIVANLVTMVPLWYLAKDLFKNKLTALLSLFLFSISFEAVSYGRWLSNPALAVPPMVVFYWGLWRIITNKRWGYLLAAIGLALAIQSQLFLLYLLPVLVVSLIIFRVKVKLDKYFLIGLAVLFLLSSTFLAAEVKFGFQGMRGLSNFLSLENKTALNFSSRLNTFVSRSNQLFARNLSPSSPQIAPILLLVAIAGGAYLARKDRSIAKPISYSIFILFSTLPLFLITKVDLTFITVGVGSGVILLAACLLTKIKETSWPFFYLAFGLIFISNATTVFKENSKGNIMFQVQEGMRLTDEMEVVKTTYYLAKGGPLSINAITDPLFYPSMWAYLYNWEAQKNGKALPSYHGYTHYSFAGDKVFPRSDDIKDTDLTIVEPEPGIPLDWKQKILATEETRGRVVQRIEIGKFTILARRAVALR